MHVRLFFKKNCLLAGLTFKTTCKPPSFTLLMWNPSFSFFFLIVFHFSSLFCSFHPSLSPATIILFYVVTWTIFFIYNTYRANISDRYVFNLLSLRYYAITSLDSIGQIQLALLQRWYINDGTRSHIFIFWCFFFFTFLLFFSFGYFCSQLS